jgi:proton glutamate symport protein
MKSKCDQCGVEFDADPKVLVAGGPLICTKCEFNVALKEETAKPAPDADKLKVSPSLLQRVFSYNYFVLLKKPVVILAAIAGAVLFGLYYKDTALILAPFGGIYLALLKMCVFPILITAIITSVGKLFVSKEASSYVIRILVVFTIMLFMVGAISLGASLLGQPGSGLAKEDQVVLGKMLSESDKKSDAADPAASSKDANLLDFVKSMIPENIFSSLNEGSSLQILFFSLILGVASGFLPEIESRLILSFSESLFKAFFGIISWILYLLPFGLFCLISSQIASTGIEIMMAMFKFVIIVYASALVVMVLASIIIWVSTGRNIIRSFIILKDCLLIALGTQSTFASMPSQLEGLKNLQVSSELSNLVVPIGAVICRFSMVITYTIATIFTAQLYGVEMTWSMYAITVFLSILAAVAGAGTPGIVAIAMISIVLGPLGLPSGAIIVMLLAINPVIDPITTMANVHAIVAGTTLVAKGARPMVPDTDAEWGPVPTAAQ